MSLEGFEFTPAQGTESESESAMLVFLLLSEEVWGGVIGLGKARRGGRGRVLPLFC
jgi:hypothetical protein